MSALNLLLSTNSKPYKGFSKLEKGNYEIVKFRFVKNKMFKVDSEKPQSPYTLLVELADQVLFLPDYISKQFDEKTIDELNTCGAKVFLCFGGQIPKSR